jgi:CRISPR-associated protein Cmr4
MTEEKLVFYVSESPVHVGCGQAMDAVDLPVIRERATGYPYIPGSSVKGVMRADFRQQKGLKCIKKGDQTEDQKELQKEENLLFGEQENAGSLLIGDLNLLFFPVRCYELGWVWLTCPDLLRRFDQCSGRLGSDRLFDCSVELSDGKMIALNGKSELHLEEFLFTQQKGDINLDTVDHLETVAGELEGRLVIINDKMFNFFVRNATEVVTRIGIDEKTGVVKNGHLFYEECLSRDVIFYNTIAGVSDYEIPPYLRMGGDRTIGRGIFRVKDISDEGGEK